MSNAILYPVLFLAAFVVIFAALHRYASIYDEGLILTGAMRVGSGEIPHRDFYANYGPAQFYVVALLFKLFGPSVMIEQLWDFAIKAAIATLGFGAARVYCGTAAALATYGACLIWLAAFGTPGFPLFPAILFSLAATLLIASSGEQNPHRMRIAAAGGCVGLAALFRYDVGGFVGVALMVLLIVAAVRGHHRFWRIGASPAWLFALGAAIVFGPWALAYLLAGGPVSAFIHDIVYASTYYVHMRRLPFPSLDVIRTTPLEAAVYFPPAVVVVAASVSRRSAGSFGWAIAAFVALCCALYLKGWVRISALHVSGAIIAALILLPMLWKHAYGDAIRRTLVVMCAAFAALPTFFALTAVVTAASNNRKFVENFLLRGTASCDAPEQLRPVACINLGAERSQALQFIIGHTAKDQRLFVGTTRHDKIFVNDNLFYFAAQRLPATHWHHYDPGLQTRADVQNDMAAELERQTVPYIVLISDWDNVMEPNSSALGSGVRILDDYIARRYETVAQYGTFSILARRK